MRIEIVGTDFNSALSGATFEENNFEKTGFPPKLFLCLLADSCAIVSSTRSELGCMCTKHFAKLGKICFLPLCKTYPRKLINIKSIIPCLQFDRFGA